MGAGYGQKDGEVHPNISPGLPMSEREHDHTTTKATLTEGTILLNKDMTPVVSTALELGINTDLSQANNQTDKPKDINKALNEQQQIVTAVGHVKSAVENYVKNQRKAVETEVAALEKQQAEAKSKGNQTQIDKLETQLNTAKQRRDDWGTSGTNKRITDTVTNVLTTAIAGEVSTGFDVYNGEANYEKTLANFALAGIKAGKSTSQQLSIDAIYNGLTLANDKTKSDEEIKDLSISKIAGSVASISIDYGFKSNGIGKQVITNVIGNYTENRVSETIKNNKKKDGGKID